MQRAKESLHKWHAYLKVIAKRFEIVRLRWFCMSLHLHVPLRC